MILSGTPSAAVRAGAALDAAAKRLRAAGSPSPRLDAELLLAHALGHSRTYVLAHAEEALQGGVFEEFEALVRRRAALEPMAYVLGEREFYGRVFKVDQRALIPRPETELLVDLGLTAVRRLGNDARVFEVGTGSGAVAISLALAAGARVSATDVSWEALELARENACTLGARVHFVQCDLLRGIRGPIDVLLANLPYVPTERELPSDVRDYEPHVALFGGARGTELIEELLRQAQGVLAPDGELCVELDEEEQAQPVATLARQLYPAATIGVERDGGGYDRVVRVRLNR